MTTSVEHRLTIALSIQALRSNNFESICGFFFAAEHVTCAATYCTEVSLYWMDPSVADREDGDVPDKPADWRPDFEISNAVDLEEVIEPATIWDSSGLVRMAIRYRGTVFQPTVLPSRSANHA